MGGVARSPTRSPGGDRTFTVAYNPDPDSTLRYLIRLPVGQGWLVLKAADTWPRTSKVYCHPADEWPHDAEVVEEVAVRSCTRRGPAIDLVLDRARESRSQLVFTTLKGGRKAIFWQSLRTAKKARPGVAVPTGRAAGIAGLTILVDTRERYPYKFARQQVATERRALPQGDYGVEADGEVVAVVERKGLDDLASSLTSAKLELTLAELATLSRAAVVVEDRYSSLLKHANVRPAWLLDCLAAAQTRYPEVPVFFAETRPLAEEWTYRFLAASLVALGHLTPARDDE